MYFPGYDKNTISTVKPVVSSQLIALILVITISFEKGMS